MRFFALLLLSMTTLLANEARDVGERETQKLTMGNGDRNWIIVHDATRSDKILTFSEVNIAENGWLVMHPFENGKPNGDKYVAATFVQQGINSDVQIEVYKGVTSGEKFIVMLHNDSNSNGIFDFVFIDDNNVMDKAVFEGGKMIGHVFIAPDNSL